jgi:hypothetical protein
MHNVLGLGVNIVTEPGICLELVIGPVSILIGNIDAFTDDDDDDDGIPCYV